MISLVLLSGCSVFTKGTQPVPGAERNLTCILEYRPSADASAKPDLLFMVMAFPYRLEEVYMNPIDTLFHAAFAPGRYLLSPIHVSGATCDPPTRGKGYRLPTGVQPNRGLACRRSGLEQVVFEAETKHGQCRIEIPADDSRPRCRDWLGSSRGQQIERILGEACRSQARDHS